MGALINAGAPLEVIEGVVRALKLRGVGLRVKKERRGAVWGTRVFVDVPRKSADRDCKTIKA